MSIAHREAGLPPGAGEPAPGGAAHTRDEGRERLPDERTEVLVTMSSRLSVAIGAWLLVAPLVLDYSTTGTGFHAYWSDVVTGIALISLGALNIAVRARTTAISWALGVLGCWLVAAPLVLRFAVDAEAPHAAVNDVLSGTAIVLLSWLGAALDKRFRR